MSLPETSGSLHVEGGLHQSAKCDQSVTLSFLLISILPFVEFSHSPLDELTRGKRMDAWRIAWCRFGSILPGGLVLLPFSYASDLLA